MCQIVSNHYDLATPCPGRPAPILVWRKDGKTLNSSSQVTGVGSTIGGSAIDGGDIRGFIGVSNGMRVDGYISGDFFLLEYCLAS